MNISVLKLYRHEDEIGGRAHHRWSRGPSLRRSVASLNTREPEHRGMEGCPGSEVETTWSRSPEAGASSFPSISSPRSGFGGASLSTLASLLLDARALRRGLSALSGHALPAPRYKPLRTLHVAQRSLVDPASTAGFAEGPKKRRTTTEFRGNAAASFCRASLLGRCFAKSRANCSKIYSTTPAE